MGCTFALTMALTFLGPEYLGRRMDAEADRDFEEACGGHDAVENVLHHGNHNDTRNSADGQV